MLIENWLVNLPNNKFTSQWSNLTSLYQEYRLDKVTKVISKQYPGFGSFIELLQGPAEHFGTVGICSNKF